MIVWYKLAWAAICFDACPIIMACKSICMILDQAGSGCLAQATASISLPPSLWTGRSVFLSFQSGVSSCPGRGSNKLPRLASELCESDGGGLSRFPKSFL